MKTLPGFTYEPEHPAPLEASPEEWAGPQWAPEMATSRHGVGVQEEIKENLPKFMVCSKSSA